MSGLTDTLCHQLWQRLEPRIEDVTHAAAHHIPTIDAHTNDGDDKHIRCYCGDLYAYIDDWVAHAIVEVKHELVGEKVA